MRRYKVTYRRRIGKIVSTVVSLETSVESTSTLAMEDVLGKAERRLDNRVWSIELLQICSEVYKQIQGQF